MATVCLATMPSMRLACGKEFALGACRVRGCYTYATFRQAQHMADGTSCR